jgi:hypothetical protein
MNGNGIYKHYNGYYYDGLFQNGLPNKLLLTSLSISIEKHNNRDEIFRVETNKHFKLTVKTIVANTDEIFIGKAYKYMKIFIY